VKVAVIGAGISGLGSAWLLSQEHEVHLFESDSRLGGHAHTVTVNEKTGSVPIDTGFLVYNEHTYPNLTAFFKELEIETIDSDMSLSIQVEQKGLEWSGTNLNTVFGQRSNLLKPRFYLMLREILRFGRDAEKNLSLARRHAWSLGELMKARGYSLEFATDYLLPIGAAIWSTPELKIMDFPAATFLTFFINHKLLQVNNRPIWKTVKNGSIQYVQKAAARISKVHLSTAVHEVERIIGKVLVKTDKDCIEFDRVVMATHAPVTARILKPQSDSERSILSAFSFEPNRTILHSDPSFMPERKRCWSAWNVFGANDLQNSRKVSLSYYLNLLQHLPTNNNYFVTLNPTRDVQSPIREFEYSHPQFDQRAVRAQRDLPLLQGKGGVFFAGAWSRYGFHEDGILSAVKVAELMGVAVPWLTKSDLRGAA
jgi:predicted NAD/FAD-binding protein